jgi:ubiquinol-cytochrome c reductase iron-sulfur subunit
VLLMRLDPAKLTPSAGREDWGYNGIVAYSKICTHVGCPVALYEQQTHHLLCPCHQSTFDLTQECKVIFGPASRPLPQLPIAVDDEGYLVATSDFKEPVGPSYWERDQHERSINS